MTTGEFKRYISIRLKEIEEGRDVKEYVNKGRFNFGMDQRVYGHLPSWNLLVKGKKKLVRLIWVQAFFSALMAYAFAENWEEDWWKVMVKMLIGATIFTLFHNIFSYFSIAFEVNKVQKQVQRLLYEDLLHQLKQEEVVEKN